MQLALVSLSTFALAAMARAQEEPAETLELSSRIRLVGTVVTPVGLPAGGAVIESSAGGEAVADADGGFELVADVPFGARWVDVTATVNGGKRGSLTASARVLPATFSPMTSVGTLVVAPGTGGARWLPTFGHFRLSGGPVLSTTVFDDGDGPALHVGGSFSMFDGREVEGILRWDGSRWSVLDDGVTSFGAVEALVAFDDGTGPALYAGGGSSNPARWDGSSWSSLGSGVDGAVHALAVFDDGSGPALYATGAFATAGGVPANNIARWDGTTWSAVGSGLTGLSGRAMEVFDDGNGDALYVAGNFTAAGGVPANRIARWDGSTWQALGSGLDNVVYALCVFDDGNGPALYAGGNFDNAGGSPANEVARWNGASWAPLGSGMAGGTFNTTVRALVVFDSGSGASLHAGGDFTTAGGVAAHGAARWNGASWAGVGDGVFPYTLEVFNRGQGPELYAGIQRLDGGHWASLFPDRGPGGRVEVLLPVDVGGSRQLYAAGDFVSMDGVPANRIARWDGSTWSALGSGIMPGLETNSPVEALALYDDGGGEDLYAGGVFTVAGGVTARGMARWDGAQWSAVGSFDDAVYALIVFDDGSGPKLYAGCGSSGPYARRWNGVSWQAINVGLNNDVLAFAVFDDGSGPALYAGGVFTNANGGPHHVARWTGSSWVALGSGMPTRVSALASFDDGSGPALYAAGDWSFGLGLDAHVSRWNGTSWSPVGTGVGFGNSDFYALAPIDDGSGPALHVAGSFFTADGVSVRSIAKWDGASWSPLGAGLPGACHALAQFEDDGVPALIAGGHFVTSPARDRYLAKWSVGRRIRKD